MKKAKKRKNTETLENVTTKKEEIGFDKKINELKNSEIDEMESKEKSQKIVKSHSKVIQYIAEIGGLSLAFQITQKFFSKLMQWIYRFNCSNFYKIPGEYFSTDIVEGVIKVVMAILLLILLFGYRNIIKKIKKEDNLLYKILFGLIDLTIGLSYGSIVLNSFITIVNYIDIRNLKIPQIVLRLFVDNVYIILIFIVVLSAFAVWTINYSSQIENIKSKIIKKFVAFLGIISFVITIFIFATGMFIGTSKDARNKTDYEIITFQGQEYIVLNKHDDKYLIVEFYEDNNEIIIFTHSYKNVDIEGLETRYENWGRVPVVNSEKCKEEYLKEKGKKD